MIPRTWALTASIGSPAMMKGSAFDGATHALIERVPPAAGSIPSLVSGRPTLVP